MNHNNYHLIFRKSTIGIAILLTTLVFVVSSWSASSLPNEPKEQNSLAQQIDKILKAQAVSKTQWGIYVESDLGEVLYQHHGETTLIPASVTKLVTTASAMALLGPNYRIPTEFLMSGILDGQGILQGDLVVKGYGDPSLAALEQWDAIQLTEQWSDTLKKLGLKSITGSLWGDGMATNPEGCRDSWDEEDLVNPYGAEVCALSLADNSLRISVLPPARYGLSAEIQSWPSSIPVLFDNRILTAAKSASINVSPIIDYQSGKESLLLEGTITPGSKMISQTVPLEQPTPLFLAAIMDGFKAKGITSLGGIGGWRSPNTQIDYKVPIINNDQENFPKASNTLFVHWSPPLCKIIEFINTESHNLGAELLIRHLGWKVTGNGVFQAGEKAALRWITAAGLDTCGMNWVDGSGLARINQMTPQFIVQMLQVMNHSPWADDFRNSLAVMGKTGTLRGRGTGNGLVGQVWAKTGSMSGVRNIAGYMKTRTGKQVVFCIMANSTTRSSARLRYTEDQILNLLYESL
jgi:D-alanyl-D-alanine carboxypeptidase/D-alanyl-D-alanine-endopeptidase (penicillin-binding protein 4)